MKSFWKAHIFPPSLGFKLRQEGVNEGQVVSGFVQEATIVVYNALSILPFQAAEI